MQELTKLYFTEHMLLFQTIDLSGNQLRVLPSEVSQLTSATSLTLDDNQLRELPAEMKQLSNLKSLSLRNNSILPEDKCSVWGACTKTSVSTQREDFILLCIYCDIIIYM